MSSQQSFAALRHPGYRAYFFTSAIAMMADNIEHVISYWMLYEKFHSPALGGVAILTHWLPFLFLSIHAGALADRFDKRRLIQIGQGLFALASLGWGLLFFTDQLEAWHAVVLLTIHGLAGVIWATPGQVIVHDMVGKEHLQSAIRLNATARFLGVLMGPGVGGVLLLALGPAYGLLANMLFFLPLIFWLRRAPYGMVKPRAPGAPARGTGFAELRDALREAAGNRTVISMIVLGGASSLLIGSAYMAQMPEFAHDLGSERADWSYSVLLAANAAGAFAGGMILESRSLLRASPGTAIALTFLWCVAIGGFAMSTSYPLAVLLMLIAGFLYLTSSSMSQTLVQMHAPEHLRGRLVGVYNMANNGLRAFSGITVGIVGSLIGIHWSLALAALVLLTVTLGLLAFTRRN
ncbi:MAG: MFS transporter [Betaproteobacteria bacterium]|nr:MFS transporter [Betaproteobacteria bacterium]